MKYFLVLLGVLLIASCTDLRQGPTGVPAIVPEPKSVRRIAGALEINGAFVIKAQTADETQVARFLLRGLRSIGADARITENQSDNTVIALTISDGLSLGAESYELYIDEGGIKILAGDRAGLFYGTQSLIQILVTKKETVPYLEIKDAPRFGYRGMHLDVTRHMFPVSFIKKYIDMMSYFKFNTFHWHLTDDQGWRIEIKQYPELQKKGAYRAETAVGYTTTRTRAQAEYDGKPYGGFYTQEEIEGVVSYASARNITVIPEIELPGHARAALAAYPHLGCVGKSYETATTWGVFQDIYCAGKESTFEFLENVFDEVLPLFPGPYVHIGGDEAPKSRWEKCPHCQQRIAEEGLKDEHELQSYFVQRMESYLNGKGKSIIGWDEILEGGLAPNALVMSWRGESGGIAAAKENHQVIMTPTDWCYFDYYQADMDVEPLAIKQITTVEKVYGYEPVPAGLTKAEKAMILGAQCNLWSEYVTNGDHAEYMVYPRAIAMSEVLWSPRESRDYTDFVRRARTIRPLLDVWGINYAPHIFQPQTD